MSTPAPPSRSRALYRQPPIITPAPPPGGTPSTIGPAAIISGLVASNIIVATAGTPGSYSINVPLSSLSPAQLNQLNLIGFNITQTQIQQSATTASLVSANIITVDSSGNATLVASLSSLTPTQISQLNSIGFNITQAQVTAAQQSVAANATLISDQTSLEGAGMIGTNSSGNLVLQGNVANATPTQINQLLALGFTQTNITTMQNLISLERAGIAYENSKGEIVLEKDPSTLTAAQKSQLQTLGFTSAQLTTPTGTTKFTPTQIVAQNTEFATALKAGQITQTQYNEAMAQQNANLTADQVAQQTTINSLVSQGIITSIGPLYAPTNGSSPYSTPTKGYTITNPTSLTPTQISQLNSAGFNITSTQATKIYNIQDLVADGIITVSGTSIKLARPVSTLSPSDITKLQAIDINIPNLPTKVTGVDPTEIGASMALNQIFHLPEDIMNLAGGASNKVPKSGNASILSQLSFTSRAKTAIQNVAAITGTIGTDIANGWNILIGSWVPGSKAPTVMGPTASTLKYYTYVSPSREIELQVASIAVEAGASYLAMMPIGFTGAGISAQAAAIGEELDIGPQISPIINAIKASPMLAKALVLVPLSGLTAGQVYEQYKSGVPADTILENVAKNIAVAGGAFAGLQAGWDMFSAEQLVELKGITGIESTSSYDGTSTIKWGVVSQVPADTTEDIAGINAKIDAGMFDAKAVADKITALQTQVGTTISQSEFDYQLNLVLAQAKADPFGLNEDLSEPLPKQGGAGSYTGEQTGSTFDHQGNVEFGQQPSSEYTDKYLLYHAGMSESGGGQTMVAVKTMDDLLSELQITNIEQLIGQPLIDIPTILSEATPAQIAKLTETMDAVVLADSLSTASPSQLTRLIPNISAGLLANLIPMINSGSLSNTVSSMSTGQLNSVLSQVSSENLIAVLSKTGSGTISTILTNISPAQLVGIIQTSTPAQLTGITQAISASQLIGLMQGLSTAQGQSLMQSISTGQLQALMQAIGISTVEDMEDLLTLPHKPSTKIFDAEGNFKQGTQIFEVKFAYSNNSTQTYNIKAKSFHGAVNQAMQRRSTSQIPSDVKVTIRYELKQEATS